MIKKAKSKVGRPKEIEGFTRPKMFYLEQSRLKEFEELCQETGISVSEGMRQLIEQELDRKKDVGLFYNNPISIPYKSLCKSNNNNGQMLISSFMTVQDGYHELKNNNIYSEELNNYERYGRNFLMAIEKYKPNAPKKKG